MDNESLDPLEQELRGLCLRRSSPALDWRVLRACVGVSGLRLWLRVAAGVAVGVALGWGGSQATWPVARLSAPVELPVPAVAPVLARSGRAVPVPSGLARIRQVWHVAGEGRTVGELNGVSVRRAEQVRFEEVLVVEPEHGRTLRLVTPHAATVLYGVEPY